MLSTELKSYYAVVAELVDARVLGTRILWCGSSSLPDRMKLFKEFILNQIYKSFSFLIYLII